MITLIIGLNIAIALFGFYLAWRIWQLKRVLTAATVALTAWEHQTHDVLNPARTPELILRGQQATASTRERYLRLLRQLRQLQQIFAIALTVFRLLQGPGRRRSGFRKR